MGDFVGLGVAVARRPRLDDVRDEDLAAAQAGLRSRRSRSRPAAPTKGRPVASSRLPAPRRRARRARRPAPRRGRGGSPARRWRTRTGRGRAPCGRWPSGAPRVPRRRPGVTPRSRRAPRADDGAPAHVLERYPGPAARARPATRPGGLVAAGGRGADGRRASPVRARRRSRACPRRTRTSSSRTTASHASSTRRARAASPWRAVVASRTTSVRSGRAAARRAATHAPVRERGRARVRPAHVGRGPRA